MTALAPDQFRILCIEDEPEILSDLAEELSDHGFCVDKAPSAQAALALIERSVPNLIVCDIQMPGMTGIELLERLRSRDDDLSTVPFVFLTAFGDRDTIITGRRSGADDYLVKPVDYDLLIASVESHLRNAAARAGRVASAIPVKPADDPAGRGELLVRLAACPPGTPVAVAKIDNLAEVTRRFGIDDVRHAHRLSRRLAGMAGVELFWLQPHCCVVLAPDEHLLDAALARMVGFPLRDRSTTARASVHVAMSIVSGRTLADEPASTLIDRLFESARLVQRDGGGRILAVNGHELSDMRLAHSIRTELINAIDQGQMHVCFQPKVRADDGRPFAAEVLVRWDSPLLGHLSPATFIPVVERAGLLSHVTDWVLHEAARSQVRLTAEGLPARLAVNIGASEFNSDLADRIARIFAEHGADVTQVEVEITETSLLLDPVAANAIVQALHARGIAVALDDFGTGFSSLSHLQACAVDAIKIDRSFVRAVAELGTDQKIVLGILGLAKALGMETIAEGVELESQRRWLTDNDCNTLQGYLISRPLRFDSYKALLRGWPDPA